MQLRSTNRPLRNQRQRGADEGQVEEMLAGAAALTAVHGRSGGKQSSRTDTRSSASAMAVASAFSVLSSPCRRQCLLDILSKCTSDERTFLASHLFHSLRVDFIADLPVELSIRVLAFLDVRSLCKVAQVCRQWNARAKDDTLWCRIYEQQTFEKVASMTRLDNRCWKDIYVERQQVVQQNWAGNSHVRRFEVENVKLMCHDDTQVVYVLNDGCEIHIWDWRANRLIHNLKGHESDIEIMCMDLGQIVSGDNEGCIRIWDRQSGACLRVIQLEHDDISMTAMNFDGHLLAVANYDGFFDVWDFSDQETHVRFIPRGLEGHTQILQFFGPDILIAASTFLSHVSFWNWRTQELLRMIHGDSDIIQCFCTSPFWKGCMELQPDNDLALHPRLYVSYKGGKLCTYSLVDGQLLFDEDFRCPSLPEDWVFTIAANKQRMACGLLNNELFICDLPRISFTNGKRIGSVAWQHRIGLADEYDDDAYVISQVSLADMSVAARLSMGRMIIFDYGAEVHHDET